MRHRKTELPKFTEIVKFKIYKRLVKKSDEECWEWSGNQCNGYGRILIDGKSFPAHAVVLYLETGNWPDNTQVVCHKCDNKKCCNPNHLYIGTQKQNTIDRSKSGLTATKINGRHKCVVKPETIARGVDKGKCVKLNDDIVKQIRSEYVPFSVGYEVLAKKFNVAPSTIRSVVLRLKWSHVD